MGFAYRLRQPARPPVGLAGPAGRTTKTASLVYKHWTVKRRKVHQAYSLRNLRLAEVRSLNLTAHKFSACGLGETVFYKDFLLLITVTNH